MLAENQNHRVGWQDREAPDCKDDTTIKRFTRMLTLGIVGHCGTRAFPYHHIILLPRRPRNLRRL